MRGSNVFMQDKVKKPEKDYNKKMQKDITVEIIFVTSVQTQARPETDSQHSIRAMRTWITRKVPSASTVKCKIPDCSSEETEVDRKIAF
jgi:hypothetical protein